MTHSSSLFSHISSARQTPTIHTVDGSTMSIRSVGNIFTSKLYIPEVFHVPKISFNSFFVAQLAELGYCIILDFSGCVV